MITIREECRGAHHGQLDLTAVAEDDKKFVGYCDYVTYNNKVSVQYIFVEEDARRKGVATKLLDFIKNEYVKKGATIDYGYATDDGHEFLKKYKGSSILESSNFKTDVREEISKAQKNKVLKILIDENDTLAVQTNYKPLLNDSINGFDALKRDYALQFLIFNFKKPIGSKDSCFGVSIGLKDLNVIDCQNKSNEKVDIKDVEKMCDVPEDYFVNYVKAISDNLHFEVKNNLDDFSKVFNKYKSNSELLPHVVSVFKHKLSEKKLTHDEVLKYFDNVVDKLTQVKRVQMHDVFDSFHDMDKFFDFAISAEQAANYEKMFLKLFVNKINMKYDKIFENDDAFTTFLPYLKEHAAGRVESFVSYFYAALTIEKLCALDYEDLKKSLTAHNSNVKEILEGKLVNEKLIEMMKKFFNDADCKNISAQFVMKNKDVLKLSEETYLRVLTSIYSDDRNLLEYDKELKKISELFGMQFAKSLRRLVAKEYFNNRARFKKVTLNATNANAMCRVFIDAFDEDKSSLTQMLFSNDLINQFVVKGKENGISEDLKNEFISMLEQLKLSNDNIVKILETEGDAEGRETSIKLAGRLLDFKKYSTTDRTVDRDKEFMLALAYYAFKNDGFEYSSKELGDVSKALDLNYNSKEDAFEIKIKSLNDLRNVIIYDEDNELDLEHVDGTKESYVDDLDFHTHWTDVSDRNKKALSKLSSKEREKKVNDAVNIAIADGLHKQLLHAIFNRLFRTRYFKQWSDNKYYHIDHGFYVILASTNFIKPALFDGYDKLDVFQICKQLIANENKYVELQESDFDGSYDKVHMNHILAGLLE